MTGFQEAAFYAWLLQFGKPEVTILVAHKPKNLYSIQKNSEISLKFPTNVQIMT